jgi:hypothetical protein
MADETADLTDPMRRDAIVEGVALARAIRALVRNDVLLGRVDVADVAMPWFEGRFEPTDDRQMRPREGR